MERREIGVDDTSLSSSESRPKNSPPRQISNEDVQNYHPEENGAPLEKSPSLVQRVLTRLSFFNARLKSERRFVGFKFLFIYALMGSLILALFSIYWGSSYERSLRFPNLRMLVVIEDDHEIDNVPPAIGDVVNEVLQSDEAKKLGNWVVWKNSHINELANSHNNTIYEEIKRQVHHQKYWASIYVKPNASLDYRNAIISGNTSNPISNSSIVSYYETGRDFLSMSQYVEPNVKQISNMVVSRHSEIVKRLLANDDYSNIFTNQDSVQVASTPALFVLHDAIPLTDSVLVAPGQVGLIYMIIITFFSLNFFMEVHQKVAKMGIKPHHMMLYRILSSLLSFFVISLFYSLVTLAFQVDFTVAFGKSGFLVYWMTNFLTMWAVGAMNEAFGMLCIMSYPPLMGFWMIFWVIINISPTFSPIALCAKFYRYGYAMPIHASYEITKVIFFDTYKGAMGRNYGILIAWDVLATIVLIVVFYFFAKVMAKRAMAQKKEIESQYEKRRTDSVSTLT